MSEQAALTRILSRFNDLAPVNAEALLPELVEAARSHLSMEVGFISEFKRNRRYFRYVQCPDKPQFLKVNDSEPLEESYCQRVVDGRLPTIIQNAQENEEALTLPVTKAIGLGAHLSVPILLADGSVFGTFCCFSLEPDYSLSSRDASFMAVLAQVAGAILDRELAAKQSAAGKHARITRVLKSDVLRSVWQPITDLDSGQIVGVEALARFNTQPKQGPHLWFQDAADVGLGIALEHKALLHGLEILPDLPQDLYLSFNASAPTILEPEARQHLESLDLYRLVLEITEHDKIVDYAGLAKLLKPLRDQGLRLAVDDFGAGISCFQHILLLKPDIIKLDICLVRDIHLNPPKKALVQSLVDFAHERKCRLIAEGVETDDEVQALRSMGVCKVQGFLFHKPLERNALLKTLAQSR